MGYTNPLQVNQPSGGMSTGATSYATVDNYIGAEATASALGALHKPEVDEEIVRRYGRDDLTGLLSSVPGYTTAIKNRKEYFHFEKDFIHGVINATATEGAAGAAVTFTLATSGDAQISYNVSPYTSTATNDVIVPQVKDILLLPSRIEVIVLSVTLGGAGATTFSAAPLDPLDVIPTLVGTEEIIIKTNAEAEGSLEVGKTRNSKLLLYQNNMGIHRRKHVVTGSEMGEQIWVKAEGRFGSGMYWHYEGINDEYHRFKNEEEMTHFDGKKITNTVVSNTAGFETITKTEGLVETIDSYGTSHDYGAALLLADVKVMTKSLDKFKGDKVNLTLSGYNFREQFNALWRTGDGISDGTNDTSRINFANGNGLADMAVNLDFERAKLLGYTFVIKQTNAFSDPTTLGAEGLGYTDMGIVIPTGNSVVYNDLNDAGSKTTVKSIQLNYKVEQNGISRLYKEWVTGGAGGASTNGEDNMTIWFLSENGLELSAINKYGMWWS